MRRTILAGTLACGVLAMLSSGCAHGRFVRVERHGSYTSHGGPGHGPPPHAPAHGYRRKHETGSADLTFDRKLGVYVVHGHPNLYYWNGTYLRLDDGRWYASRQLEGGWRPRSADSLPPGLQKKHGKGKEHPGRGHGPAKGHW